MFYPSCYWLHIQTSAWPFAHAFMQRIFTEASLSKGTMVGTRDTGVEPKQAWSTQCSESSGCPIKELVYREVGEGEGKRHIKREVH